MPSPAAISASVLHFPVNQVGIGHLRLRVTEEVGGSGMFLVHLFRALHHSVRSIQSGCFLFLNPSLSFLLPRTLGGHTRTQSIAMGDTVLPQGAGYGIIIGFGALFALGMWWLAKSLAKFQNEVQGSEMFMTAQRSIKTGLVASAVVSSWTIAATLLTSSTWAFEFGMPHTHTIPM